MKFLVFFCLLSVSAFNVVLSDEDDDWPCETDLDCPHDECCTLSFTGNGRICRDIGDDWGEPCGGLYFCPTCRKGLECKPVTLDRKNEIEGHCPHPANGTCVPPAAARRGQSAYPGRL